MNNHNPVDPCVIETGDFVWLINSNRIVQNMNITPQKKQEAFEKLATHTKGGLHISNNGEYNTHVPFPEEREIGIVVGKDVLFFDDHVIEMFIVSFCRRAFIVLDGGLVNRPSLIHLN